MDCFKISENNVLQEGLLSVSYNGNKDKSEMTSLDLPQCQLLWEYSPIHCKREEVNYYSEIFLNAVLQDALGCLSSGTCFTIPVGGIRCLKALRDWSESGDMIALIGDKAYNRWELIDGYTSDGPPVAIHGSISLTVNLSAVSTAMQHMSPISFAMHTPQRYAALDVSLFAFGLTSRDACLTSLLFEETLCRVGVYDIFCVRDAAEEGVIARFEAYRRQHENIQTQSSDTKTSAVIPTTPPPAYLSITVIARLIHLCGWDPDVLVQFADTILPLLKEYTTNDKGLVAADKIAIEYIRDHHKSLRKGVVSFFDIDKEQERILGLVDDITGI